MEHLSLLAHLSSLFLSHPPITMVATGDEQLPQLRPFLPLRSSLPCDVHLLNLRTLEDEQVGPGLPKNKQANHKKGDVEQLLVCFGGQKAGSPSLEAALLLHRKGFDCDSVLDVPLQCTWSAHEEVTHVFTAKILFYGKVTF